MSKASAAVATFKTKDELARAKCLTAYIDSTREHQWLVAAEWAEPFWPEVGYFVKQAHAPRGKLPSTIPKDQWLDSTLIDLAKAYVKDGRLTNPSASRTQNIRRLQVLRQIETALLAQHRSADPLRIDQQTLSDAARLAKSNFAPKGAHHIGAELKRFSDTMVRKGILPSNCSNFVNPNKQPTNATHGVDGTADQARKARLPDDEAIYAIADIFCRDFDLEDDQCHKDIITTSAVALLMSAPSRGEEIFRLPVNLTVRETDKFGDEQMGLRLHASKGFGAYVKWVWIDMAPVAEKAISRVKAITEEARALARHLESRSRNKFFRHSTCPNVLEDAPLTKEQVCMALGYSPVAPRGTLRSAGVKAKDGFYTLRSLWRDFVLPRHLKEHPYFPYVSAKDKAKGSKGGLKFSDALFCTMRHQANTRVTTSKVMLSLHQLAALSADLGQFKDAGIFERYSFKSSDSQPLKLKSHQPRHLINTEAQRAGLSDDQIAHWSGRLRASQNQVYDHQPLSERVDQARGPVERVQAAVAVPSAGEATDVAYGQWVVKLVRQPRSLTDIADVQPQLAGLKTLYGECHHDWGFAPCAGFVACLNCSEHACVKGLGIDAEKRLNRLKALLASVELEIDKAQRVRDTEIDGQEWLDVQSLYASKVRQLIELLESDAVTVGSIIRSAKGDQPDHLHRALRGLAAKALEAGTEPKAAIKTMLSSLERAITGSTAIPINLIKG